MPPRSDSIRTVVRCSGHTKTGARCKRRTAKSPLCYYHLEKEDHVKIKKSTIPGAGLGLFTTIARRPNQRITLYGKNAYVNHDPDHGGEYVVQVQKNPPTFVDARRTTDSAGRYANEARRGIRGGEQGANNAALGYSQRNHEGFLKSKDNGRGIPAGKELKATYGAHSARDYWAHRH
jgi:hypothetical protein